MAAFNLEDYAPVDERIAQLYQDFQDASIRTFMVVRDGPEVIFEARIYRTPEEAGMGIYTSGFAREVEGANPVNRTSHLEACETSAIGRALANLGYTTNAHRPSRNEMLKVARMKEEHDAMLAYIRSAGAKVKADAVITVKSGDQEEEKSLKAYLRDGWTEAKERFAVARRMVEAIEGATGIPFAGEE